MWHNVGLTLQVFPATLLIVLLLMVCGWYFVWNLFLSKFKFLRELVGDTGSQEGDHEPAGSEVEEDNSGSPHRMRPARQRRALQRKTTDPAPATACPVGV